MLVPSRYSSTHQHHLSLDWGPRSRPNFQSHHPPHAFLAVLCTDGTYLRPTLNRIPATRSIPSTPLSTRPRSHLMTKIPPSHRLQQQTSIHKSYDPDVGITFLPAESTALSTMNPVQHLSQRAALSFHETPSWRTSSNVLGRHHRASLSPPRSNHRSCLALPCLVSSHRIASYHRYLTSQFRSAPRASVRAGEMCGAKLCRCPLYCCRVCTWERIVWASEVGKVRSLTGESCCRPWQGQGPG